MVIISAQNKLFSTGRSAISRQLLGRNGFSMVEVIVATLIFAMATAGILATLSALSRPAAESTREVQAAFIAQDIIESLRGQITTEAWVDPAGNFVNGGSYSKTIVKDDMPFLVVYNVTNDFTGAKEITVNVSW
ncbi:MAG TPA: prepilin-type N-terminal cleavage/methylation domain-containing protein [Candidatus Omnitrophota bacterium]|nr:prepilin-type N-terminal cleavage/methylation domain-containing protein [Candidatus Omnitrophota bacterium]